MSSMSECFRRILQEDLDCKDIMHSWTNSCWTYAFRNLKMIAVDSFILFIPISLIPLLPKIQRIDREMLVQTLKDYGLMVFNGYIMGNVSLSTVCLMRKLLGKFYYSTTFVLPAITGGLLIFWMPKHLQLNHGQTLGNLSLEIIIRQSNLRIVQAMRKSRIAGSLCFALMSTSILHILRYTKLKSFWFVLPKKHKSDPRDGKVCFHEGDCGTYIKQEIQTYAKLGLVAVFAKKLIFKFNSIAKEPLKVFQKIDYGLITFLTSYIGFYRATTCLMNNYFKSESEYGNLIAGFVGGLSYYFYPNYNFFAIGMTILMNLTFEKFREDNAESKNKLIQLARKVPLFGIFYVLSLMCIVKSRLMEPGSTPRMANKMMDYVTNKGSIEIGSNIFKIIYFGVGK